MNVGLMKKRFIFCEFSNKFSSNLLISLIQNISVLDKSRKFVSCVRENYENKTQMLFNPSIQFFTNAKGLLLIEKEGTHYSQLKFTCVLNRTLFSYASYPRIYVEYIQTLLKALYISAFYIGG